MPASIRSAIATVLLLTLVAAGARADAASAAQRRRDALEAEQVILGTHLFTNNRGMHIVPGIFDLLELIAQPEVPVNLTQGVRYIAGFNMIGRRPVGLFNVQVKDTRVGVLGCAGCHSGRAAGRLYVGLNNKNIDVGMVGRLAQRVQKPYMWTRHLRPAYQRDLIDQAMGFTAILANPNWMNFTQGLVPVSNVWQWFYKSAGLEPLEKPPRGAVKPAHLWGYKEKRTAGLFSDGFGDGTRAGWAAAVEITAGQTPETVHAYYPKLEELEHEFEKLLPPPYPFAIDARRAAQGKGVFAQTCSGCHGTYERDSDGFPIFKRPNHIPIGVVGTDADRLDTVTPEFRRLVAISPLKDILKATDLGRGYFAPRLDGIWARFGYLHNASVPNVASLLTPPGQRPRVWSLHDAGEGYRFDPSRLGLTIPRPGSAEEASLLREAQKGKRDIYWTGRIGQSSQGHPFGTDLEPADKAAIIEYLKTL